MVQLESNSMYCWLGYNIPSLVLCYITKVKPLTPFSLVLHPVDNRDDEDDVNSMNVRNNGNSSGGNGGGNNNGDRGDDVNNNNNGYEENIECSCICTICGGIFEELWDVMLIHVPMRHVHSILLWSPISAIHVVIITVMIATTLIVLMKLMVASYV
eukprot:12077311-Ditylum_brightwellii.AAC.1